LKSSRLVKDVWVLALLNRNIGFAITKL